MRKRSRPESVDRSSPEYAREVALRLLKRREHSRKELVWKLEGRGLPAGVVAAVSDRLEAEGLLSEARFAEVYIRSRADRGYGPQRLRAELRERGISDPLIEESLAGADIDWLAQADRYYQRRFGDVPPKDWKDEAKRRRAMEQHGYTVDQIRHVIRQQKKD